MTAKRFWMSFDLGIDGDYDTLFSWLDSINAVECGESMCSFQLEIGSKPPDAAVLAAIKRNKVKFRSKDRIYLIWRRENSSAATGRFIVGKRKRAPWSGYAMQSSEDTEDA